MEFLECPKRIFTYILAAESLIHALTSIITGINDGNFSEQINASHSL